MLKPKDRKLAAAYDEKDEAQDGVFKEDEEFYCIIAENPDKF